MLFSFLSACNVMYLLFLGTLRVSCFAIYVSMHLCRIIIKKKTFATLVQSDITSLHQMEASTCCDALMYSRYAELSLFLARVSP